MIRKIILVLTVFAALTLVSSCAQKSTPPYDVQSETIRAAVYAPADEKEYAQSMTSIIGRLYDEIRNKMGIELDGKVSVIAYPSLDGFKQALGDKYREGLMSTHSGNTVYTMTPSAFDKNGAMSYYALPYEYVQIMLESANKKIPWYLNDGIAAYLTSFPVTGYLSDVQKAVNDKTLPTISELEKANEMSADSSIYSYIFVDYIMAEYGYDKLAELVKNPKIKKVFGKSEDEFYNDWLVWSKNAYARDFDKTKETEHFILEYMADDENIIDEMAGALEGSFERITGTLKASMMKRVTMRVYPTFGEFNRAMLTPNSGDGHLGNAFSGTLCAVVSPNNRSAHSTREGILRAAVHEFAHTVMFNISENIPSYLNEGTAAYLAGQSADFGMPEVYIPLMFSKNAFPDMQAVKQMTPGTGDVYVIGYTLADYIVTEYGNDALIRLLKAPDDYSAAFGKSEDEFYNEWVQWLKEKYCK